VISDDNVCCVYHEERANLAVHYYLNLIRQN